MLIHELFEGAAWVDSRARLTNTNGTPLVSAVSNESGRRIPDNYSLTFADVVVGVSANVTIATDAPDNKYRGVKAVVLDGATIHRDVIPGLDLVFSGLGTFTAAWTATVKVGEFLGTFDAFGGSAGTQQVPRRYRVRNAGTGTVSNAKARLLPMVRSTAQVGLVFSMIKPFAEGATEKQEGGGSVKVMSYALSILNVAGAGAGKTAELRVDGVALPANSISDVADGTLHDGTGLKAVAPGRIYRVVLGALTGLEFSLDANVANGDWAKVLIFATRFRRVAPEAAPNVAGVYGTADVVLTAVGSPAGQIPPGESAYYWADMLVPSGGNASSNPLATDVAITATEGDAADY